MRRRKIVNLVARVLRLPPLQVDLIIREPDIGRLLRKIEESAEQRRRQA